MPSLRRRPLVPQPFTPLHFQGRLKALFQDRLRLRWSLAFGAWLIEQKVGRAAFEVPYDAPWNDRVIQMRDGYAQVMLVAPGTSMPCPACARPLTLAPLDIVEIRCAHCASQRHDVSLLGGYFPLDEVLLDHLKLIDPERGDLPERVAREEAAALRATRLQEEAGQREASAQLKDALLDQLPTAGFPSLVPDGWHH